MTQKEMMERWMDYLEKERNAWKDAERRFYYESEYEPDLGSLKWTVFNGPRKEGEARIDTVKEYDTSPEGFIRSLWPGRRRYRSSAPILAIDQVRIVNDKIMRPGGQGVVYRYWIQYGLRGELIPPQVVKDLQLGRCNYSSDIPLKVLIACIAHDECIPFEEI